MILVDANLLIYATAEDFPQHPAAKEWLESRLGGRGRVGIPWASVLAFVRIVSNPKILREAPTPARAFSIASRWLELPNVFRPEPGEAHAEILASLLGSVGGRFDLVPDAHLAALAVEHGLVLASTDGDFGRFRGLRWENPLAPTRVHER